VLPLSADKTLVRTTWLVHKEAIEGKDYDLETLTRVWSKTNVQDATFVAWASAGTRSPAYEPGPYSPNENQLEKFLDWYIERMSHYVGDPANSKVSANKKRKRSAERHAAAADIASR
jgi:Rieske 2Fe-2S family protein